MQAARQLCFLDADALLLSPAADAIFATCSAHELCATRDAADLCWEPPADLDAGEGAGVDAGAGAAAAAEGGGGHRRTCERGSGGAPMINAGVMVVRTLTLPFTPPTPLPSGRDGGELVARAHTPSAAQPSPAPPHPCKSPRFYLALSLCTVSLRPAPEKTTRL